MKYVLIPNWLEKTLTSNGLNLTSVLDLSKLSTILSAEEVAIYTLISKYDIYGIYSELKTLLNGIGSSMVPARINGLEYVNTEQEAQLYNRYFDSNNYLEGLTKFTITGSGAGSTKTPTKRIWVKPVLIGMDTIGFVFVEKDEVQNVTSLYEELFAVLRPHLDGITISKTKMYENYISVKCKDMASS